QVLRERRVDAKVRLLEGSAGLARTKDSPYLEKFPDDKKELFKYDLIILGDVDSRVFSTAQLESIEEFVSKFAGGLAVIAGQKNNPWTYRKTQIERKMPVVAVQQYVTGQVMFVGTDNTWRWRKNKGDEQYVTLWGQVIQRLALPHLLELDSSKRTQVKLDKKQYVTNEKVNVYARLYTASYAPIIQDKV